MAQPYWINQHNKEKPAEKRKGNYLVLILLMFLWSLIILWAILRTVIQSVYTYYYDRTHS